LRTAISDVDARRVHIDRHAAQRSYAIGDHNRSNGVRGSGDRLGILQRSGGRFRVNEGHRLRALLFEECGGLGFAERLAPGFIAAHDLRAVTAAHFGNALAEEAGNEDGEFHARSGEVGNRGFHARAAGAGDGNGERIRGAEQHPQIAARFLHRFEKEGVQITDHGLGHGLIDARFHLRGSGSEQQAARRGKSRHVFQCSEVEGRVILEIRPHLRARSSVG